MSEVETLFLVLAVIYLIQCVAWVPQDSIAFRPSIRAGWRVESGGLRLGAGETRGILANPLPPLGSLIICHQTDVAVSPRGVARRKVPTLSSRGRREETADYVRFDEMKRVAATGKEVRVSGALFLKAHSAPDARHFAELLEKLRRLKEPQRAAAIEKELAASLDAEQVSARFEKFRKQTGLLRWTCNQLFLLLFVVTPLVVLRSSLARTWPFPVSLLLFLIAVIAWNFRRAHRLFYPADGEARWTAMLTLILSPPVAIRANDSLTRDLFSGSHPLAIARALCSEESFQHLAARMLREVVFPLPAARSAGNDESLRCEEWFREKLASALRRFVAKTGTNPEGLLEPPPRESPQCISYCPRCCHQYVVASGTCLDCGGIALLSLPLSAKSSE